MAVLRAAVAVAAIAVCGALWVDERQAPHEARRLGQTEKQTVKAEYRGDASGDWFGTKAAEAEAEAHKAYLEAEKATEEVHSNLTAHQMEAIDRHAEADLRMEVSKEMKLDHVADSLDRESDAQIRTVDEVMRRSRQVEAGGGRDTADFERDIRKIEKEAEVDYHKDDKAINQYQRREREEASKWASEEQLGARQLRDARRQVDSANHEENQYQHHRGVMESETRKRLWQEADAMRREASNGTLPEEEVLRLLDTTKPVLDNMTWHMMTWGPENSTWFEERLDGVRFKSAAASAKMVEAVKHKVAVFHSSHLDYDTRQFVSLLARLFSDTRSEIGTLEQTTDAILDRLQRWDNANPEKFTYTLALALRGATGNVELRNHLLRLDTARLGQSNASEACGLLDGMMRSNMAPAYRSLGRMREALDNMSKIVPSMVQDMPVSAQAMVANRTTNVLNMAYVEHLALKESAIAILQDAAPVVLDRLRCEFQSASVRSSALGPAVAAALAAAVAAAACLGQ